MTEDLVEQIKKAVASGDEDKARTIARNIVETGLDVPQVVDELSGTMHDVGTKFQQCEIFLSGLMLSDEAMKASMSVFQPILTTAKSSRHHRGKVVIGTVQGDIHDIGKNIVSALLTAGGFEIFDIGVDAPASRFIEKAKETNADIIAASALMTTTIAYEEEIIKLLKALGIRDSFRVIIGGGAVTAQDAERMGADGFAEDAPTGVEEAARVLGPALKH